MSAFPALLLLLPARAGFVATPYLQDVSQDSVTVCWEQSEARSATLRYGPSRDLEYAVTAPAETFQQVELDGLEPSTRYFYQVEVDGGDLSELASFLTAPRPEEPFSFVVLGDTRTDAEAHAAVVAQVLRTVGYPEIYFNTGDLVEDGEEGGEWEDFFSIEAELLAHSPFYPVAGNHDDVAQDSLYTAYFALPAPEDALTENYYAFTYGNSRFIVLDTNIDFDPGSEQYAWLESELSSAQADASIRHVFAFFHHPPYSSGVHGVLSPDDWEGPREALCPLLESYGVDIVFSGHDHDYERSDPSLTGGVTYVVTGGGGAPGTPGDYLDIPYVDELVSYLGLAEGQLLGEYVEENPWVLDVLSLFGYGDDYEGGWWRAEGEVMKHFLWVEVQGGLVTVSVYTEDGELFESWSLGSYDPDEVDDDGDGYTEAEGDCDDADASVHPGAEDPCDGVDQDCDGTEAGCGHTGDTGAPGGEEPGAADTAAEPADTGKPVASSGADGCGCAPGAGAGAAWLLPLLGLAALARRRGRPPA